MAKFPPMVVDEAYVRAALLMHGIPVKEEEMTNVRHRLTIWLTAYRQIEEAMGDAMDEVDALPPVFPQEDFD